MASSQPLSIWAENATEEQVFMKINSYVENFNSDNAIPLAELYYAKNPQSNAAQLLLARAYISNNEYGHASTVLRNSNAPENIYLLAKCFYRMKNYVNAEEAMNFFTNNRHASVDTLRNRLNNFPDQIPGQVNGIYLLAQIAEQTDRVERACELYRLAYDYDVNMISAYESLCRLGKSIPAGSHIEKSNTILPLYNAIRSHYLHQPVRTLKYLSLLPLYYAKTPLSLMLAAKSEYERKRLPESKSLFKLLLRQKPYENRGMDTYSSVLWQLQDQASLLHLEHALESNIECPDSLELRCARANRLSLRASHAEAVATLREGLQRGLPGHRGNACRLLALELLQLEEFAESAEFFERALAAAPADPLALFGLASAMQGAQAAPSSVEAVLIRSLQLDPCRVETHLSICDLKIARCAETTGGLPVSEASVPLAAQQLARQLAQQALQHARSARKLDPAAKEAAFEEGRALCLLGRPEDALPVFEDLLGREPTDLALRVLLGKLCKKLGKREEAMLHWTHALAAHQDLRSARTNGSAQAVEIKRLIASVDDPRVELNLF